MTHQVLSKTVAQRFALAQSGNVLLPLFDDVLQLHERALQPWVARFGQVLNKAQQNSEDLPSGWVRQEDFVSFLSQFDEKLGPKLELLDDRVQKIWTTTELLDGILDKVRPATTEPEHKASLAYAVSDLEFFDDGIAYRVTTLKEWASAFEAWSKASVATVKKIKQKLQNSV